MIVPMKHLLLLCTADDSERTLGCLRDLGVVHLEILGHGGASGSVAKAELDKAENAARIVLKAAKECPQDGRVHDAPSDIDGILALQDRYEVLKGEAESLRALIRRYLPFGDFDPALAKHLESAGVKLRLWDDGTFDFQYGGHDEERKGVRPVSIPDERLSEMRAKLSDAEREMSSLRAKIASVDLHGIVEKFPELRDAVAFAVAKDEMEENRIGDGGVHSADAPQISLVRGWVADDSVDTVRTAARANGWGLSVRDPDPSENPPTLIRPPRLFAPVKALFDGLGIAPAYNETDVSVPFMCYFSLFFAMLVGDGGYGAIILAITLFCWFKNSRGGRRPSKVVKSWLSLLTVFSVSTVAWGFLSNTWFGAGLPFAEEWPTVKWLADPSYNNMMLLCFTIGVSHLMLARIWSGLCMLNDRTCLSQFGWAGIVLFMYLVTNSIVGIFSGIPHWAYWMFGVSLVLVFGFTLKGSELKSRGVELGMLPLNIMSALGDIISYVRLFAVGLASVKVAQNFNEMAVGLDLPLWLKVVPMVLILLVGHGLNFAMAGLSILVHAVRLNTLEFSNHKGISWAGYAFRPFRREVQ